MVQSNHAVADFIFQFPEDARIWHDTSNSIITLSVNSERELYNIPKSLEAAGIKYIVFREPDIGNAITAIALCPGPNVKEFCKNFKTSLRPDRLVNKKVGKEYREILDRGLLKSPEDIKQLDTNERKLRQVVQDMMSCEQTKDQSILEHGTLVNNNLQILLRRLRQGECVGGIGDFRLPRWFDDYKQLLLEKAYDDYTLEKYAIFHDCGKPYCLTVDEDGKRHFLNHADVSYKTWINKCSSDEKIGKLIKMDMDIHTLKYEDIPEFAVRPEAISLLLAGLAEIHANAKTFGGMDSDCFKIKWKHIDRRGKAICNIISELK